MAKAKKKAKTGWSRRKFLQTAGVAVATMAFPEILISCGPQTNTTPTATIPKPRKGASIRLLQWTSFVKQADTEFKRQAAEWGDANGVTVAIETVTGDQLQPKTAAAVEANSGPDIIQMQYAWPHLYTNSCVDLTNDVNILISKLGKPDPVNEAYCKVDGVWRAMPYTIVPNAWTYRTDYFTQAGVSSFPSTWDELTTAAGKLKSTGKPISQTDGHAYGDSLTMWNPVLWGFGGK
ncbi:MAG TPA: extracellular solute-binding protein, partial [Candidatus Eisenbacteria bacterium]|nr:extracellular solute-binding protein [Candidatus Eisenbacteria bacterium]